MRFSIIMPVLNEEAVLEQQLCQLAQVCAPHDCELLIVDGGSVDATVAIAQRFGRVISSPRGRAAQMNRGAATATGDILLFLHADSVLPDDAFIAIKHACAMPGVVGGAFRLCFNCHKLAYRLVAYSTNLRSRWRGIFTGDQAYFVRAESFKTIGGFPDIALMEDLEIIARLRQIGKVVLLPLYVTTSARRHEKNGLARTVLFMWYLRTLYKFGVSPDQLQRKYLDVR
ncbi:MAG TPA: TIGR04283 family arsenosugar biosynthesis glycosyltransferase [Ktedonobacteraceae bacterium]|nr:TIGR04283 family arsenosugar biosynthesis glycosyltransferase [Ktedonobacteraceae bacterium]